MIYVISEEVGIVQGVRTLDLVITYFIAGTDSTNLPVFIFSMMRRGVKPEINAIATLLILASLIIAAIGLCLRTRKVE